MTLYRSYSQSPKSLLQPSYKPESSFDAPFTTHEQITSSNTQRNQSHMPERAPAYESQVSSSNGSASYSSPHAGDSHRKLDYTLPVSGYSPDEITVTIDGRKVKVHGKHVEKRMGGRKTHNEFTKMFDLPSSADPEDVRCYIKDGHTLHVIAHIASDVHGSVHFLAINKIS